MRPWCAGKWALGRVLVVLSFEVYLAVHLGMVRSPALSAGVGVGNLGPAVGVGGGRPTGESCGLHMSHPCPCCHVTPHRVVVLVTLCLMKQGLLLFLRVAKLDDKYFWN